MEWLIFLAVAAAIISGVFWARKHFRAEIDRAQRIRRANRNGGTRG